MAHCFVSSVCAAALMLQAAKTPEPFWPQTLVVWSQVVYGFGVVAAGFWALVNYRRGKRLKAAEILLQMEGEFRVILPTYELIDDSRAYEEHLRPVLCRVNNVQEMLDGDLELVTALDRCLRFFVLCKVLNKDLGVEGNALLRSYYYHVALLAEVTGKNVEGARREELPQYLDAFYPTLCQWVTANRANLIRLREGKSWRIDLEPRNIMEDD